MLVEYAFEQSRTPLEGKAEVVRDHARAGLTIVDHPGEFASAEAARWYARRRAEELQAMARSLGGRVVAAPLEVGHVVVVQGLPGASRARRYLLQAVRTMAEGMSGDEDARLSQHFVAVPLSQIFRPARNTAKPLVSGVQTATVVAAPPDAYGRIRVRFHWQHSRGARGQSTAWLRVVQPLVSPGAAPHGLLRPRPGQEVLVLFDEGDPNRPLAAGILYNDQQRGKARWSRSATEAVAPR